MEKRTRAQKAMDQAQDNIINAGVDTILADVRALTNNAHDAMFILLGATLRHARESGMTDDGVIESMTVFVEANPK